MWDADDYREHREQSQKRRWGYYERNKELAERAGAEYEEKSATWIFKLGESYVHFYPTKNWWRIVNTGEKCHGGFKKFWKWYKSMNTKTIPNFETRQIRLNQSVQFVNRIKAEYKGTPINHSIIPMGTGKEDIEKNPIMRMLPVPIVRCLNDQIQLWGEDEWRALPEFLIEFHKWYKAGLYPELLKGYTQQPFNDGQYRAKKKRGIVVNAVGCRGGWIQVRQIYSDVIWMIPRTIFDELYMPEK